MRSEFHKTEIKNKSKEKNQNKEFLTKHFDVNNNNKNKLFA